VIGTLYNDGTFWEHVNIMINFNRNGKLFAKNLNGNFFYQNLQSTRQTMFKRAFGVLPERHAIVRKERLFEGGKRKSGNPVMNYQESLLESRQYVQGVLQLYATLLGAELSQVVHAVTSGNREAFAKVLLRRIQANTHEVRQMVWDTQLGANVPKIMHELRLPRGHRWTGNPKSIEIGDVEKMITSIWEAAGGTLTEHEAAVEGGEGGVHQLAQKERKKAEANYRTSRKNSMQGVEIVNAKQKARRQMVAGG